MERDASLPLTTMSDLPQLTGGICAQLNDPINDNTPLFDSQPTLQLLSFKKVAPTGGPGGAVDRYRVIVSDGQHFLQSMLATQLNHIVEEDMVSKGAIAVIEKFTVNFIQGRRYVNSDASTIRA